MSRFAARTRGTQLEHFVPASRNNASHFWNEAACLQRRHDAHVRARAQRCSAWSAAPAAAQPASRLGAADVMQSEPDTRSGEHAERRRQHHYSARTWPTCCTVSVVRSITFTLPLACAVTSFVPSYRTRHARTRALLVRARRSASVSPHNEPQSSQTLRTRRTRRSAVSNRASVCVRVCAYVHAYARLLVIGESVSLPYFVVTLPCSDTSQIRIVRSHDAAESRFAVGDHRTALTASDGGLGSSRSRA